METLNNLDLDKLGVLRRTLVPERLQWMDDDTKRLMVDLLHAGEEGLHKRIIEKFKKAHDEAFVRLDMFGLVQWVRDKSGKPMFVSLTWKGQDEAELLFRIAKNETLRTYHG